MTINNFGIWNILTIITIIGLIVFWKRGNAVWGGLTIGAFLGLLITIFYLFKGDGFIWNIIGKGIIIGALFGIGAELLGSISNLLKGKP